MTILRDILYNVDVEYIIGDTNIEISDLFFNSKDVIKSSLFVAVCGVNQDGHTYISSAIKRGAIAIVLEKDINEPISSITYIKVNNSSKALSVLSSNFFDNPCNKLKLIGITGTNGKTSTAYYVFSLLKKLNFSVGLISTIENKINDKSFPSSYTTPDSLEINRLLYNMVENQCEICVMEVSSHGLSQNRVYSLNFDVAVFTNLTRDHLDFHKNFSDYLSAKKIFFDQLNEAATSIINKDDEHFEIMVSNTKSKKVFYSLESQSDYSAQIINNSLSGLCITINKKHIKSNLVGKFNAYNLLSAYSIACELGLDQKQSLMALKHIKCVPGRFNIIRSSKGVIGIIDYAHTPDALLQAINTIIDSSSSKNKLITLIGCGGNRDKGKRPIMGKIAAEHSSYAIFTSDNPRFEEPDKIIIDMCSGLSSSLIQKTKVIIDRESAIKHAVEIANPNSVVLIAGKGHENYQEIAGSKLPFSDIKLLTKYFKTK